MTYNPNCPYCKVELDFDDHYDMYDDGDTIVCRAIGHCPKCGKHFKWEDLYTFCGFQDFVEDE